MKKYFQGIRNSLILAISFIFAAIILVLCAVFKGPKAFRIEATMREDQSEELRKVINKIVNI